jgi:hypothetical protein
VAIPALILGLSGCGGSGTPDPGPDAGTAQCTALLKRLPATVLDRQRTDLDVTGAAAWGDPSIVLRCGVTPTGPTPDRCAEYGAVDWVFTETKEDYKFITFGRSPAVEVTFPTSIDRTVVPGAVTLLAPAVQPLKVTGHCT